MSFCFWARSRRFIFFGHHISTGRRCKHSPDTSKTVPSTTMSFTATVFLLPHEPIQSIRQSTITLSKQWWPSFWSLSNSRHLVINVLRNLLLEHGYLKFNSGVLHATTATWLCNQCTVQRATNAWYKSISAFCPLQNAASVATLIFIALFFNTSTISTRICT